MINESDFYESNAANELVEAYQKEAFKGKTNDWLFLICLFLTLLYN